MRETLIRKDTQTNRRSDIEALRADFSWARAEEGLAGLPGGLGLNIAYEAVDRHVDAGRGTETALRWVARDRSVRTFTYKDLSTLSNRFANALIGLGVERGATVFSFLGRVPELFVTALGTWKRGAVFCPLFSAFGPEPIKSRMTIASACVLVTTQRLYQRKVVPILADLPFLKHIILIDGGDGGLAFDSLLRSAGDSFIYIDTQADELSTLHFTSGTTGKPKGAMHVHGAVVAHVATARMALDLRPSDVYWCTADPGWVTGTSYGIIAPLAVGATAIVDQEEFDAERWYSILADERINVWYTAPTAIRMLMRAGEQLPQSFDLSALRFIASVGEPLNPEAVLWGDRVLGRPIHDNWWQSETGGIMIANVASMDIKPGSMGKPLPGIEAAIVQRLDGKVDIIDTPDTDGELALKRGWPSMFRGYLGEKKRYEKCFNGDWYLTEDLARRDADGYYWFVSRADDIIKSAGHLIGPFEVESALIEHEAVAEAAVIGVPDEVAGEVVKAFVALSPGQTPTQDLRKSILAHARRRLGPAVAPRIIDFEQQLPKTRSGKIMRRLLKARELGLPEGDTSTLEKS